MTLPDNLPSNAFSVHLYHHPPLTTTFPNTTTHLESCSKYSDLYTKQLITKPIFTLLQLHSLAWHIFSLYITQYVFDIILVFIHTNSLDDFSFPLSLVSFISFGSYCIQSLLSRKPYYPYNHHTHHNLTMHFMT